jgi:hypothetical protein
MLCYAALAYSMAILMTMATGHYIVHFTIPAKIYDPPYSCITSMAITFAELALQKEKTF